jgi:hypothetical protein
MFNEILTGKASIEPKPAPLAPYREPGPVPPVTKTCVTCSTPYHAPASSPPGLCGRCNLEIAEANARVDRLGYLAGEEQARRAANSHRIMGIVLTVLVAGGLLIFKFGMRSQMREDAAQAAGYSSYGQYESVRDQIYVSDDYSYRVDSFADDMCVCSDLACARNVQAQFKNFLRSGEAAPSDDRSEASARESTIRMAECQQKLETATP